MFAIACALVHAWQTVAPAVVEYVPAPHGWQRGSTRRNPALQILCKRAGHAPAQAQTGMPDTHHSQVLLDGMVPTGHATYCALSGLFVQSPQF